MTFEKKALYLKYRVLINVSFPWSKLWQILIVSLTIRKKF